MNKCRHNKVLWEQPFTLVCKKCRAFRRGFFLSDGKVRYMTDKWIKKEIGRGHIDDILAEAFSHKI